MSDTSNEVRLRGTLTRDPKSGRGAKTAWAFAGVKPDGGKNFFSVKAFGEVAEKLGRCRAGDAVAIIGHLENQKQKDSDRWELAVVADSVDIGKAEPRRATEPPNEEDEAF